jgi:Arc/MetJ-type ribon-helix-helix transcriptional regulator
MPVRISDMMKVSWATVNIPEELLDQVREIVENHKDLGYASSSEYIRDAIRIKLQNDIRIYRHKTRKKTIKQQ